MVPAWCRTVWDTSALVPNCLNILWRDELSNGDFGTSAEVSQHFMKGPKYPTDTFALVPNCLRSEVSWVRSVRTPNVLILYFVTTIWSGTYGMWVMVLRIPYACLQCLNESDKIWHNNMSRKMEIPWGQPRLWGTGSHIFLLPLKRGNSNVMQSW